jgi:hypothetical protein
MARVPGEERENPQRENTPAPRRAEDEGDENGKNGEAADGEKAIAIDQSVSRP